MCNTEVIQGGLTQLPLNAVFLSPFSSFWLQLTFCK